MTRALVLWVLLLSCARPPGTVEVLVPPTPTLESLAPGATPRDAVLHGAAPDAVVVRLFVDDACAGPVWREVAATALAEGVPVDLVPGENVFAARASSSSGGLSDCSLPVRTRLEVPGVPDAPSRLTAEPGWQAASLHFVVRGRAPEGTRVRYHLGTCTSPTLRELSADEFSDAGVAIDFDAGGQFTLAFDAVNAFELLSSCTWRQLQADVAPPTVSVAFASPLPSSEPSAWVVATGDFESFSLRDGADCSGNSLGACNSAGMCAIEVFPLGDMGVWAVDRLGNEGCVARLSGWSFDALASPAVQLRWENGRFSQVLQLLVPGGRPRVAVYASPDCSGATLLEAATGDALVGSTIVEPLADGGAVSARAFFPDGGADVCSLPLR